MDTHGKGRSGGLEHMKHCLEQTGAGVLHLFEHTA
jgi:hypothetical protein